MPSFTAFTSVPRALASGTRDGTSLYARPATHCIVSKMVATRPALFLVVHLFSHSVQPCSGLSPPTPPSNLGSPSMSTNSSSPMGPLELPRFASRMAKLIVRDGEGASQFVQFSVEGAHSEQDDTTFATSSLVKCAVYSEDANWGKILWAALNC
ncbi:arginine biosynthesis bifunctional protein ArgJ, mitochondrial [Puccinia sorghi]|uniref:Arginine biosynthesis bifunctional protein ArgJ, mitochondrial n=1 Tax=Puccinia sorghi TaxID=27349 RepID=A0A0L6VHW2_9BASI|nr:arginine biosynthesis bifunctional protein ArgJ, mitochondrial [Puccinia sorghi]